MNTGKPMAIAHGVTLIFTKKQYGIRRRHVWRSAH
jgi:hypothetical protein